MTPTVSLSKARPQRSRLPLWPPLWVGALLAVAYGSTLAGIQGSWFDPNADMGHGLAVPFVAAYMVWTRRDALSQLPRNPNLGGLLLVLLGAVQFIVSSAADWVFATRSAFMVSLVGCVLCLWGAKVLRELAYPLGVLLLMIAPPTFLQANLTLRLQLIASRLAEVSLDALGYSVLRDGNILELVGERLAVAEACSGIRALTSLLFFCVTYCFFFVPQTAIRWVLVAAVVPLAIFGNAVRIVATGMVGQYNRALAHGLLHETWGYLTIFIAGGLIVALHLLIWRGQLLWRRRHAG